MPGPDVSGGFARERVFRQKIQNILLALKQSVDKVYKPRIIFIASKRRKPDLPVKTWLVWRWNTEGMWQWVTVKIARAVFDWVPYNKNQSCHSNQSEERKIPQEPMRIQSKAKLAVQSAGRENACDQVLIGVSFASDWLREWRKFLWANHRAK